MVIGKAAVLVAVLGALLPSGLSAATQKTIDLATTKPGQMTTVAVGKGELNVRIIHLIPSDEKTYSVDWEIGYQSEPPLTWPRTQRIGGDPCIPLNDAVDELRGAKEEGHVPGLLAQVEEKLAEGSCVDSKHLENARTAVSKTQRSLDPVHLPFGAQVTYTITRMDKGAATKNWVVVFQAPKLGEWFLTYGFTFIPNEDELYTTKPIAGEEGGYEITRNQDNREFDFVPAVFYAYMPNKWKNRYWSHSLGAGLGFDLSNPVVYLGYSGSFRHNVSLLGGLTMHKQRRLAGQYSLDDPVVGEPLTEEQLTEETYRPNWFIGVAFRFGAPPETHAQPQPADGSEKDQDKDKSKTDGSKKR